MKSIYIYICSLLLLMACGASTNIETISSVLDGTITEQSEKATTIDKVRRSINKENLSLTNKTKLENGVEHQYVIYSRGEMPLIIEESIFGGSYTIRTTYYIYDSTPYFISSMMRDEYRSSGNFTHQEQVIYLDGKKVIQQLKRVTTNQQNTPMDMSSIAFKDVTAELVHPSIDAQENKNNIKKILALPND